MGQPAMPGAQELLRLHDAATQRWHQESSPPDCSDTTQDISSLILAQHCANFDLWHQEDEARDPEATDARITDVKHAIDRLNQQRNDLVERIDGILATSLNQDPLSPLHSETPGMIIDRLSILALKVFHTLEEAHRVTATDTLRDKNCRRLAILEEQRNDLARCFDQLLADIRSGKRRFKIYKQMKMYNDPELNPVLYRRAGG